LEEFAVADSPLPEDAPFVASANGVTQFAYSKFYDDRPTEGGAAYTSHRITLRRGDLPSPPPITAPAAPTNLTARQTNGGAGSVTLNWADNSDNEDGFFVERLTHTGAWAQVQRVGANTTTLTISGVHSGLSTSTNSFRVRAFNTGGNSAYSNEATTPSVALDSFPPETRIEPASVRMSASASDPDGVTRVEFYQATDATYPNYALVATDTAAPYEHVSANVPAGYYYVKARAYDALGNWTETDYQSFVVYARPTVTIMSPVEGSRFPSGTSVTVKATARANNTAYSEGLRGVEFFANTTLVGSVQGHFAEYTFTWTNPPDGNYTLKARATTSLGVTGESAPVQIAVGLGASLNISGRVTGAGGAGLYNVRVALSGGQSAVVHTNANGNYVYNNVTPGGAYAVTPSASGYTFSPQSFSTSALVANQTADFGGTPGPPVSVDPNDIAIYAQPPDSRGVQGPSSKIPAGQLDSEVADDFETTARITRVRVRGSRGGHNAPPNPPYLGIFVRFYADAGGMPGELQAEHYLPKGAPGVFFDAAHPTTFDVTLPQAFQASGRH
ncbi:MAG TPA: Ig-like domain-containing protein, partial [Pyrinomonadaceae bacterium]|nr:Ig-like domain-containing protein [Pyrinomonadaceae bacterium]